MTRSLANSGDFDPTIDCGEGSGDVALIDYPQYGDVAASDCESVQEAAPNSFRIETELPPTRAPAPPLAVPPEAQPLNRFRFGGLKLDRRDGTARLQVMLPGAGRVTGAGHQVRRIARDSSRASIVALAIRPKRRLAKAMRRGKRRARVALKITFTPTNGTARSETKTLTLIRNAAPS